MVPTEFVEEGFGQGNWPQYGETLQNVGLIYHNQVYLDQRIMKISCSQYLVAEGKTVKIKTRQIQFWKMTDLTRAK